MSNSYSYAELYNQLTDDILIQGLTSGWMTANASSIQYNGGNTVKFSTVRTNGMGDYTRDTGYHSGAITQTWESFTFNMDRSAQFTLDAMDNDETAFTVNTAKVLSEFNNEHVIPEIDSYRYSKIFDYANLNNKLTPYTPSKADIYTQLKNDIAEIEDIVGPGVGLVITMSVKALNVLEQSTELSRELMADTMSAGQTTEGKEVSVKVRSIDGHPIVKVSSARMKSLYEFAAGGGFSADANALDVNWLITARYAPVAAVKRDKLKMFDPDKNQKTDGWLMQYRQYHDLWIMAEKVKGIWANYTPATAPALSVTVAGGGSGATSFTATAGSGNTLAFKLTDSAAADDLSFGIVATGITAYTSGDDIAATAGEYLNMYELDAEGKVVKSASQLLEAGDIT